MIQSPLQRQRKKKRLTEGDLIDMHNNMMIVYGWIPLDQFRELPLPTLLSLARKVEEEIDKKEHLRLISLKFYGVKNPK